MKNVKFNTLDIIATFLICYSIFNFFHGNRNILRYQEERRKSIHLQTELEKHEKIYQRTINEINSVEHGTDPDYADEILKEKLNYKKKNEKAFQYKKAKKLKK